MTDGQLVWRSGQLCDLPFVIYLFIFHSLISIVKILPGSKTELDDAGEDGVFEVGRSAEGFGLDPDLRKQSLEVLRLAHAEASDGFLGALGCH